MQIAVMIPARLRDLDEADAGLAEPAGHQALAGEAAGRAGADAVGIEHRLRLAGDVEQGRHAILHAEGELVRLDDAFDLIGSAGSGGEVAVHGLDQVELAALQGRGACGPRFGMSPLSLRRVPWKWAGRKALP